MSLSDYRTLGRSGLAVSPLALGTMTFGTERWGSGEAESRAVFDVYLEAGGNFVDTADVYGGGRSEEMLGSLVAARGLRDRIVVATKSGFASGQGPHAGGNGAKHVHTALDGSLRRLCTDYIDLYWVHVWDGVTPAEELFETMATLVRAGKIRYWGLSNTPAWYVSKVATLAAAHSAPGPIALQYFYSLANREIEDEHVPLAAEFGLGVVPWSPLAYGLLTGKYTRATATVSKEGQGDRRLDGANPFGDTLFTERNWHIVDELRRVASEAGASLAQVALAWVVGRPGIASTLLGASRAEQVGDNLTALDLVLSPEHRAALDAISAPEPRLLTALTRPEMRRSAVLGGACVTGWRM